MTRNQTETEQSRKEEQWLSGVEERRREANGKKRPSDERRVKAREKRREKRRARKRPVKDDGMTLGKWNRPPAQNRAQGSLPDRLDQPVPWI